MSSLLISLSSNAYAEGSYNETYNVMGCKSYLVSKDQTRGWLIGYLNALDSGNVLQGRNPQQIYRLVDNYCRANPYYTLDDAAKAVLMRLKRQ
ncbi:MAG: hypothetical protein ACKVN9_04320 [Methylophilaceae bacterium]